MQNNIPYQSELLKTTRSNIQKIMDGYTIEQLNQIPEAFSNNLIWNYGHVIVTQQLLVYRLSGLDLYISDEMVEKYKKGTKPEGFVSLEEYNQLKGHFEKLPAQTQLDYGVGKFKKFKTYPTSFGLTLNSVEESMLFNNVHEAMHFGNMLAIRKLL